MSVLRNLGNFQNISLKCPLSNVKFRTNMNLMFHASSCTFDVDKVAWLGVLAASVGHLARRIWFCGGRLGLSGRVRREPRSTFADMQKTYVLIAQCCLLFRFVPACQDWTCIGVDSKKPFAKRALAWGICNFWEAGGFIFVFRVEEGGAGRPMIGSVAVNLQKTFGTSGRPSAGFCSPPWAVRRTSRGPMRRLPAGA